MKHLVRGCNAVKRCVIKRCVAAVLLDAWLLCYQTFPGEFHCKFTVLGVYVHYLTRGLIQRTWALIVSSLLECAALDCQMIIMCLSE